MIINSVVKGSGGSSVSAKAIDAVAQEAAVGDKVLLNPAANTMKPIQEIASGLTGSAGVMDVINNCLYKEGYKYYVDGDGNVQRESLSPAISDSILTTGWWTNYGVFTSNYYNPYFELNIQGTTYTQQDTATSSYYNGFSHSANGEYVFVSGYYYEIRDLLIYKNKIIHEFPVTETLSYVKFMRDTKGDDYLVYGDSSPYYNYARRLTPNGVGEPIALTYDTIPSTLYYADSACLGNKKNLLLRAQQEDRTDYVYEAVLDMDTATLSFTERADLAEQLHEIKLTFSTTNRLPPFVSVGSNTEILFRSLYSGGGMMCLSYDEEAGTISFFKRWDDNVKEASYDLPTDTFYYRTEDDTLYKAHTIPQPQAYSAVKPSTKMFSPDVTLTGFVKENDSGNLEVLTAEDPNKVVEPVAESGGGNITTVEPLFDNLTLYGSPTITNGVLSGFTSTSYAGFTIPEITDATSSEALFKFRRTSNVTSNSTYQTVLCNSDHYNYFRIVAASGNTTCWTAEYGNAGNMKTFGRLISPLDYSWQWVKILWDGSTIKTYWSEDGENYILVDETAWTHCPIIGGSYTLGWYSQYYFYGEIDLKDCYFKVNDEFIWKPYTGRSKANLSEGWLTSNGNYAVALNGETSSVITPAITVYPYVVKEPNSLFATHALSGSDPTGFEAFAKTEGEVYMFPDYSAITQTTPELITVDAAPNKTLMQPNATPYSDGLPTYEDGIASGFSSSSLYKLPETANMPANLSSMEVVFKLYPTASKAQFALSYVGEQEALTIRILTSQVSVYGTAEGGTSWGLFTHTSATISLNAWCWVKVTFDGTKYVSSLSTDGVEYTVFGTTETTTPLAAGSVFAVGGDYGRGYYFNGKIDLSASYINYNGSRAWTGTVEAPYVASKVTPMTGSLSTLPGSSLSQTLAVVSYALSTKRQSLSVAKESFEVVICVKGTGNISGIGIFREGSSTYVRASGSVLTAYLADPDITLTGTTTLKNMGKYWVKLTYSSTTGYELSLSTDGIIYNVEASDASTTPLTYDGQGAIFVTIGGLADSNNTGGGTKQIYLGESYIKVDGVEVWRGADIDDGTIGLPVCWKHINGVLYEYKNGVPPTRALKLQEGQSVTLPGTNNLYVTKTGDVCGLAIANSSPVGVDSSAVIGTVELSKDGVLTAYTQTA